MENCWINLFAVYGVIEKMFEDGLIDRYAKMMLEIEMDSLDFITKPKTESEERNEL